MDDLIIRKAAIDAIHEEFDECLVWDESGQHTADEVERILYNVPSAQPRPRGMWLPDNTNYYEERFVCSVCRKSYEVDTCMGEPTWDFCPGCGADMREEKQDA